MFAGATFGGQLFGSQPTIATAAGPQTVTLGFISSGEQLFAIAVKQTVGLASIAAGEQVFAPAVRLKVSLGTISSSENIFSLSVKPQINLGAVATGEQSFALTIGQKAALGFIGTGQQVFSISVSNAGAQTLNLAFIASEEEMFSPTVRVIQPTGLIVANFRPAAMDAEFYEVRTIDVSFRKNEIEVELG